MIRDSLFNLLSALLVVSALAMVAAAVSPSGGYGSAHPSIVFIPVLGVCGVLCLALAANRRQRIPVAVILTVGAIASIPILSLTFGHEPAYEPGAIRDVRDIVSAGAAYESANGSYDTLECLYTPSACIPGYPATSPTFLDATLARAEPHHGYRQWLIPGPQVAALPPSASRTSIRKFAYVAVPLDSDRRSFCGDATGELFIAPNGIAPNIRDGQCDEDPRFKPAK